MHAGENLATLLELHDAHTKTITDSSSYRGDDFKPSGGSWNNYGMENNNTIYTDTTAGYRENETNKLMTEWGAGNGADRVSTNTGGTRNFRNDKLLPSGGEWTTPQRASDTTRTNSIGSQYENRSADEQTFLISFPKDSADTGSTVFDSYSVRTINANGVVSAVTEYGPTTFGVSKNYMDTRFDVIGSADSINNVWVKYTGNIATDRAANTAAVQGSNGASFTGGTALETRS